MQMVLNVDSVNQTFKNLESLEIHLQTCERPKCIMFNLVEKTLIETKKNSKLCYVYLITSLTNMEVIINNK